MEKITKKLTVSEKGKDFKGEELTQDTLKAGALVSYRRTMYVTGPRDGRRVQLYGINGAKYTTTKLRNIRLVENQLR